MKGNDEIRMTNDEGMKKPEIRTKPLSLPVGQSVFGFVSSFVIRHSSFGAQP
jgi:hypothetical protein